MITKEIALIYRGEIWHTSDKNPDGTPLSARVTGECLTWDTSPEDFRVPIIVSTVIQGKFNRGYLAPINAMHWSTPEVWEVEKKELFRRGERRKVPRS